MNRFERYAAAIAACFVIAVWLITYVSLSDLPSNERGTFGDIFGGANAAFSGLAFVGVVYAIFLQRSEIAIAREDLTRSKDIVQRQQEQIEEQRVSEATRDFEATFFQMMRLLSDIVGSIDFQQTYRNGTTVKTSGKDVFPVLIGRLQKAHSADEQNYYERFYAHNGNEIGHYYRLLFNLLDFVYKTRPRNINLYAKLVRAQMSDSEVQLFFHNCLSDHGTKMKPLVEYFSMLKHFKPTEMHAMEVELYNLYEPIAFSKDEVRPAWVT